MNNQEEEFVLDDSKTGAYVKRSHRYQNTKDSAISLLVVGSLGLIFWLLVCLEIIHIPFDPKSLSFYISLLICIAFVVIGIISLIKSKRLKEEADEEETFTDSIVKWLEAHIDTSIIQTDETLSEADIYFVRCQSAKELILESFPDMDEDYIDSVLDDNYDKLFSNK